MQRPVLVILHSLCECVCVCVCVCECVRMRACFLCLCDALSDPKKALGPMNVDLHMGAVNQIQVLSKSSKCS